MGKKAVVERCVGGGQGGKEHGVAALGHFRWGDWLSLFCCLLLSSASTPPFSASHRLPPAWHRHFLQHLPAGTLAVFSSLPQPGVQTWAGLGSTLGAYRTLHHLPPAAAQEPPLKAPIPAAPRGRGQPIAGNSPTSAATSPIASPYPATHLSIMASPFMGGRGWDHHKDNKRDRLGSTTLCLPYLLLERKELLYLSSLRHIPPTRKR